MRIVSTRHFRKHMAWFMDYSDKNQEPIFIARPRERAMVLIPLEMWNDGHDTTEYLLSRTEADQDREMDENEFVS